MNQNCLSLALGYDSVLQYIVYLLSVGYIPDKNKNELL